MAEKLTAEQLTAVYNRGGKLLVSAAAGSGKTKVLVDRLMRYVLDPQDPANIDDFLVITYTKAAAAELRGKIAAKLSELIAGDSGNKHLRRQMQRLYLAKISTVHGFCTDILRQYAYRLDISADFRVADEGECLELQLKALEQALDAAYETAADNSDFRAFVDTQGLGRDDRQIPEIVLQVYNSARCHPDPDKWLQWCVAGNAGELSDVSETPWGRYLIDGLKSFLELQIDAFKRCINAATGVPGMVKPIAVFEENLSQLQALRDCNTWDEIVCRKDFSFGTLTFGKECKAMPLSEQMKAVRKACKESLAKRLAPFGDTSETVLHDLSQTAAATRGLVGLVREFTDCYDRLKSNRGILDFGDLEHKTLDLLLGKCRTGITAVATEIGERFREIMVDEYQDSNGIQDAIFDALSQKRQNCFMVGDVKQSIYKFRLADPSIFIDKYNTYAYADIAQFREGRKVMLSHNFRSAGGVISAVNDVFGQCMSPAVGGLVYGDDEMLREGIPHTPLNEPEVAFHAIEVQEDTYAEEAAFVADRIQELLNGNHYVRDGEVLRPVAPEDIVILLRSPKSVGGEFQYALQTRGIRCITGDPTDLLQTEEISTVLSILQVIDNPLQDIPLTAALTSPVFGFTADILGRLRGENRFGSIYTLISGSEDPICRDFMKRLNKLRRDASIQTVTQLLASVYTETNLLSIYSALPDGEMKLENLQAFYQIVSDYESGGPRELGRLLEFLEAAKEKGLGVAGAQQDKGAVTIMSIHKSKGLEFPVVFLCGLARKFNQESAHNQVLCDKDLGLGLGCVDMSRRVRYPTVAKNAIGAKMVQESVSEEMRVLYVAMTRAKDMLIMTYASPYVETHLKALAQRLDMSSPELLASEVNCPGAWILQTALKRTEAGALFAVAGHPDCAQVWDTQWQITLERGVDAEDQTDAPAEAMQAQPELDYEKLNSRLNFSYPYPGATRIPSKLTATQMKGRILDTEVAEGAKQTRSISFRKPGAADGITGKDYGNAVHSALQYIRFANCADADGIRGELERLVRERLISPEQADAVDCNGLARFFASPLGKKLCESQHVLREFKFSLLDDAAKYYENAVGEKILLQGVVDCALMEEDGITIIDFKTDYASEETLDVLTVRYRAQVLTYAYALERIYQMPVKSAKLYFFHLNTFVDVI